MLDREMDTNDSLFTNHGVQGPHADQDEDNTVKVTKTSSGDGGTVGLTGLQVSDELPSTETWGDPPSDRGGWQKRKRAVVGPDHRISPSIVSPFESAIAKVKDRTSPEIFMPELGTTFDSCQEAYEFYNLFSWEHGFGIRHSKTRKNHFGYRNMHEIVCQCEGRSQSNSSASCRSGCGAMVRLLRTEDHGWYISLFNNKHNHSLSVGCCGKMQWNSHNEIDPLARDFIKKLRENNIGLSKLYNIISGFGSHGVIAPFRKQVMRSFCSRLSRESMKDDIGKTMEILYEMKKNDKDFEIMVDVDTENRVKSILWCTGKNREDYGYFGDVVTFDTTYRTNMYNMPFGLFVGVNEHFQSTIFGGVLMCEETTAGFEWAFESFMKIMGGRHPMTILTDQCKAMKAAIKSTMPATKHRWCRWHVLRDAKEKLGNVYSKHSCFKREFHDLINEEVCVLNFEKRWDELLVKYNVVDNTYLQLLYAKRHMWARPYFMGVFCAGMTSTQRSESANHVLKQFITRSSPMHLFVRQYSNLLKSRRADEAREEHSTSLRCRVLKHGMPIEADAARVYTKAVYKIFTQELFMSGSFVAKELENGASFEVRSAGSVLEGSDDSSTHTVEILSDGSMIKCSCGWFEHSGLVCRHALKVMVRCDIQKIPSGNILQRWTIRARESKNTIAYGVEEVDAPEKKSYRHNLLCMAMFDLSRDASLSEEGFELVMAAISAARKKLSDLHRAVPPGNCDLSPGNIQKLLGPRKVISKGRPASKRLKRRLDYAKINISKTRRLDILYKKKFDRPTEIELSVCTRKKVRCSSCDQLGHNRATCKRRRSIET